MNEHAKKLLKLAINGNPIAADTVWDSVGRNAIEDGWIGGRSQETLYLALALLIKDPAIRSYQVGKVITHIADAYLAQNAKTALCALIGDGDVDRKFQKSSPTQSNAAG
jgi:hypothetical protein